MRRDLNKVNFVSISPILSTTSEVYHYLNFTDEKVEVEGNGAGVQIQVCPFRALYNFSKLFHANGIIYAEVLCG